MAKRSSIEADTPTPPTRPRPGDGYEPAMVTEDAREPQEGYEPASVVEDDREVQDGYAPGVVTPR